MLIAAADSHRGITPRKFSPRMNVDCRAAEAAVAAGSMSSAMFARLRVTERGVAQMATQVRDVAALPDPLGRRLSATELDDGLVLYKESCPLGVVGIVFRIAAGGGSAGGFARA